MYEPFARSGFATGELFRDRLVLVGTRGEDAGPDAAGYVFVDWGSDFAAAHASAYAESPPPHVFVRLGALGLQHLLANGGSGYFPLRMVEPLIAAGRLHRIANAAEFDRIAYLVASKSVSETILSRATEGLRNCAKSI